MSIASGRDFPHSYGLLNFLDGSGFFPGHRSLFLLATAFFLEVALLTIVVIGNVYLVPRVLGFLRPLGSTNVHRARVRNVRGALGLSSFLVVRLVVSSRVLSAAALLLLSSRELSVVDADSLGDELVEYTRLIFFIEFILDVLLQPVVEQMHQSFVVYLRPQGVLSEKRSVCGS